MAKIPLMATGSHPRDTELVRERLPEEDPTSGWVLGLLGLGIGVLLGLLVCGCLDSLLGRF